MPHSKIDARAYIRGEERGFLYDYRHTPLGAARKLGIPEEWILFWLHTDTLRSQLWQKKTWVRLEDVQALCTDPRRWMRRFVPVFPSESPNPSRVREIELQFAQMEMNS